MKKKIEESQARPEGPLTEFEAGQLVLGSRSGYIRGMGRSVFPPKATPLHTAQASKIKTLESELVEMQSALKAQAQEMNEYKQKMAELTRMVENIHRTRAIDSLETGNSQTHQDSCSPLK